MNRDLMRGLLARARRCSGFTRVSSAFHEFANDR
jgi:hypothetical protein